MKIKEMKAGEVFASQVDGICCLSKLYRYLQMRLSWILFVWILLQRKMGRR